jgi:glycosyltransferase involved in cell wall biosynthesis
MLISIVIPTCNEKKNLKELKAFFDQIDTSNLEIIVSDSISSEVDIQEQIETYDWKYLKPDQSNRAYQMNQGAMIAKGEILCFLHADVRPPFSFYSDIIISIEEGFDFGFFAYQFNPNSFLLNINARFTKKNGLFSGGGDQIHFIKKSLFYKLGGYDEKFVIMEDFEFFKRIKKLKKEYTIVQNPATVSSRKYKNNSYLKVNFLNLIAFVLFHLNFDIRKIKKIYESSLTK